MELKSLSHFEIKVLNHLISGGKVFVNYKYSRKDNRHCTFMTIIDGKIVNINWLVHLFADNTSFNKQTNDISFHSFGEDGAFRTLYEMSNNLLQNKDRLISLGVNADGLSSRNSLTDYERI